ncbi:hypothetical protein HOA92_00375 [archaeon]|jgi:hypothetical protein|nr:hypothetical protein [archaeon]MBT6761473.1 hypothetical protein [archaeon]
MSNLNLSEFHYFGFDESPIGGNSSGLVLTYAHSTNDDLVRRGGNFHKAKDYLDFSKKSVEVFVPTLESMQSRGLASYSWMRSNQGRKFCRQRAAHASIGRLLLQSDVEASKMVVYIDAFFPKQETQALVCDYLRFYGFDLPKEQIHVIAGGDKEVELINFADILAYRIAAGFRRKQNDYLYQGEPSLPSLDPFSGEINASLRRVSTVANEGRRVLENCLKNK